MRAGATERTCWHCADDRAVSPLLTSGSMTISALSRLAADRRAEVGPVDRSVYRTRVGCLMSPARPGAGA